MPIIEIQGELRLLVGPRRTLEGILLWATTLDRS